MQVKIVIPKKKGEKFIKKFFLQEKIPLLSNIKSSTSINEESLRSKKILRPQLKDLYFLFQIIYLNKRLNVLEFGSGWSTYIFSIVLNKLKNNFKELPKLRIKNTFSLYVIENSKKYLNVTKKRIENSFKKNNKKNKIKIKFTLSTVVMTEFNGQIATMFTKLPMCNPDFIYLDGPDQFNVRGQINGISTRNPEMMPMSCDILKIEPYLIPGTIVLVDGRAANARFLKYNLKRNWIYSYNEYYDNHIFLLKENSLGKLNSSQIKFYKSEKI